MTSPTSCNKEAFPFSYVIITFLVISCHKFLHLITTLISFIFLSLLASVLFFAPTHSPSFSLSHRFEEVKILPYNSREGVLWFFTDISPMLTVKPLVGGVINGIFHSVKV